MPDAPFTKVLLGAAAFVVSTAVSMAIVVAFVVRIPPGYFIGEASGVVRRFASPVGRVAYRFGKNALGLLLLGIGLVLALPGVPGQGLLTILVGLMLLDVPGKRRLALKLVRRAPVLRGLNRIRSRFDRPPLVVAFEPPKGELQSPLD